MRRPHLMMLFSCLALSACTQHAAYVPTEIAEIEKLFGVKICQHSKVKIVDNLSMAGTSPVYEIKFPDAKCADAFLESLIEGSVYENPFGDNQRLIGSNEKKKIHFSTMKKPDHVIIFHVSDVSWLDRR